LFDPAFHKRYIPGRSSHSRACRGEHRRIGIYASRDCAARGRGIDQRAIPATCIENSATGQVTHQIEDQMLFDSLCDDVERRRAPGSIGRRPITVGGSVLSALIVTAPVSGLCRGLSRRWPRDSDTDRRRDREIPSPASAPPFPAPSGPAPAIAGTHQPAAERGAVALPAA